MKMSVIINNVGHLMCNSSTGIAPDKTYSELKSPFDSSGLRLATFLSRMIGSQVKKLQGREQQFRIEKLESRPLSSLNPKLLFTKIVFF
jgi:hypothetical protein